MKVQTYASSLQMSSKYSKAEVGLRMLSQCRHQFISAAFVSVDSAAVRQLHAALLHSRAHKRPKGCAACYAVNAPDGWIGYLPTYLPYPTSEYVVATVE